MVKIPKVEGKGTIEVFVNDQCEDPENFGMVQLNWIEYFSNQNNCAII